MHYILFLFISFRILHILMNRLTIKSLKTNYSDLYYYHHDTQPGPRDGTLKCFIRRNRTTQTYYLYIGLTEGMIFYPSSFCWANHLDSSYIHEEWNFVSKFRTILLQHWQMMESFYLLHASAGSPHVQTT